MLDSQLSTADAAIAGGIIGAMFGTMLIAGLIIYAIMIIADWKIFVKAGEKGWKALIPIYNTYIMFKIVNMQNWFWGILAVSIIGSLIMSFNGYNMSAVTTAQTQASITTMGSPVVSITSFVMAIVSLCASVIYAIRTAKVFGKSGWFAVGLFFLTPIFWLILAFGRAKYDKKRLNK